MLVKNKARVRKKWLLILLGAMLIIILVFRELVFEAGDTIRIKHIQSIATSIRANALGQAESDRYFYPTHASLLKSLGQSHFKIPEPYGNICYFVGTVQNKEKGTSDFVVLSWGTETSTLNPKIPGVIFETSSEIIKNTLQVLSPTIDSDHFACKQNKSIPWKRDMSSLLRLRLFPTHWLKINEHQQVCIAITDQKMPANLATCLPEQD